MTMKMKHLTFLTLLNCFRNQAVINFILSTPKPVLYKSLCTELERHTGEYISEQIVTIIQEIGPEKFIGIVTDNAAAMEKAKTLIQNQYDFIYGYSCISHTLNLLVGDIMNLNSLKSIESSCKEIVKEVTSSHVTLAQFNKIQIQNTSTSISLKLPVKTRWGSVLHCIQSLVACKNALQMLVVSENINISKNVKRNCLDDEVLWVKLQKIICILTPIVKWIGLLEGDTFRISQVVVAFKEIEDNFQKYIKELPILKAEETICFANLEKRKAMAMKPLHYAANLLDPCFVGDHLDNQQHLMAMEFLDKISTRHPQFKDKKEKIFAELTNYCAKCDLWGLDFIWMSVKNVDCISWWNGMCKNTALKDLAVAILGLPPSSAATERSFSTYSFIHNKRRNRLTIKRAGMLTYIAHNTKMNSVEQNMLDEYPCSPDPIPGASSSKGPRQSVTNKSEGLINLLEAATDTDSESDYSEANISFHDTNSSIGEETFSEAEDEEGTDDI